MPSLALLVGRKWKWSGGASSFSSSFQGLHRKVLTCRGHLKNNSSYSPLSSLSFIQYMFFHCGMIHSILEQPIPVRNESFQSGMNHSGVVPEIGYETYSQNSGSLYVSRIWRIFWSISIQCRAILNFPWFFFFDSLLWNDSFQSGKKHSRLEWILPDWNNIYWCGGEKPILVLQWNVDIPQ